MQFPAGLLCVRLMIVLTLDYFSFSAMVETDGSWVCWTPRLTLQLQAQIFHLTLPDVYPLFVLLLKNLTKGWQRFLPQNSATNIIKLLI